MPIDEESPSFALEISTEAQRTIQDKLITSGVAGLLSVFPGVGGAITEMLTELAIQRTNDRMREMFLHFTNKVREIGEEKLDREWFRGEEFQTLLYEALQQLHATHDHNKIEMLGVALANSGAPGFKDEERKDLFIRFVRELTPHHVKLLVALAPAPSGKMTRQFTWAKRMAVATEGDDLLAGQMLYAYGLTEESPQLRSSGTTDLTGNVDLRNSEEYGQDYDARRRRKAEILGSKKRYFRLSQLGQDFLDFMGLPSGSARSG